MNFKKLSVLAALGVGFSFGLVMDQPKIKAASTIRTTEYGKIQGLKESGVLEWKGVPYGGNVAGANRWKAPTNPDSWDGIKKTTKSITAVQYKDNKVIGSEKNALTLDIYRSNNDKKDLPVIVYVHGGNNQTGASTEISGADFVKSHDAIFVSINYRLGALGFNPLAALKDGTAEENSGNYALLDMAKSLDWVKENIAAFGGNSNNITVSGFSAGGRDVMAMLISPIFKGKFNKAIAFSGGMTLSDTGKSQKVFEKALAPLAVKDGKANTTKAAIAWLEDTQNNATVKEWLYSLSSKRLAKLMGNASIRMSVFPHLYKDGTVLPTEGFDTNSYNSVPTMLTSGSREFSLFEAYDPYFAKATATGRLTKDKRLYKQYQFGFKYGGELYGRFNVQDSANKMLQHNFGSNIYGMIINFGNNEKVVGSKMALFGAFHGVFVPLLDPSSKSYDAIAGSAYKSKGAKQLAADFQDYLYNFMISTDGSSQKNSVNWKVYDKQNGDVLTLDATKKKAILKMAKTTFTDEDILKQMAADKSLTTKQKNYVIKHVLNGRWFSHDLDQKYDNLTEFDK